MYQIVTRNTRYPNWDAGAVGEPNEFTTVAEAEAAIEELRKLGDDWANAEYDVREKR